MEKQIYFCGKIFNVNSKIIMSGNTHRDWLPTKQADIYIMAVALVAYLTHDVLERIGIVAPNVNSPTSEEKYSAFFWFTKTFMPRHEAYVALYALFIDPSQRTPVIAQQFYTAEAQYVEALRQFYMGHIRNNINATDADRVAMGFPVLKKTRVKAHRSSILNPLP